MNSNRFVILSTNSSIQEFYLIEAVSRTLSELWRDNFAYPTVVYVNKHKFVDVPVIINKTVEYQLCLSI